MSVLGGVKSMFKVCFFMFFYVGKIGIFEDLGVVSGVGVQMVSVMRWV